MNCPPKVEFFETGFGGRDDIEGQSPAAGAKMMDDIERELGATGLRGRLAATDRRNLIWVMPAQENPSACLPFAPGRPSHHEEDQTCPSFRAQGLHRG